MKNWRFNFHFPAGVWLSTLPWNKKYCDGTQWHRGEQHQMLCRDRQVWCVVCVDIRLLLLQIISILRSHQVLCIYLSKDADITERNQPRCVVYWYDEIIDINTNNEGKMKLHYILHGMGGSPIVPFGWIFWSDRIDKLCSTSISIQARAVMVFALYTHPPQL